MFKPDTTYYTNYIDKGKYLLTWRLSLLFLLIFFSLSVAFLFVNLTAAVFYALVFLCAAGGFWYLNKTKKYVPIFWMFTIACSVLNTIAFFTVMEIVHYAEILWIINIIIFAFIGLGRKVGMFFMIFHGLVISGHMVFRLNQNLLMHKQHTTMEITGTLVEILFALFTISYLLHQYLVFQTYAEDQLKLANQELAATNQLIVKKNEENSMLAKEIHHRVKNNLQIVISLLRMHSDEVKSEETKTHFSEAMNRIMTMSLIHQKLYQEKELSNIDVNTYFEELTKEIISSSARENRSIGFQIDTNIKRVGLKTIVPLGLLINELMTNSVKHAFSNQPNGKISVCFTELAGNRLRLEYSDNGTWQNGVKSVEGFGLELIQLLTSQLEGEYERTGSRYVFEISNLDH